MNTEIESIREFRARLVEQHARELATTDAFMAMLEGGRIAPTPVAPIAAGTFREVFPGLPKDLPKQSPNAVRRWASAAPKREQRPVELKDMPKRVVKLGGTRAEFDEALRRTIGAGPDQFTVVEVVAACSTSYPAFQSKCSAENVRYKLNRWLDEGELAIAGGGSSPKDPRRYKRGKQWIGPGTVTTVDTKPKAVASKVAREYEVFRSGVSVPRDPEAEDRDGN